jgi:hypothetical protein
MTLNGIEPGPQRWEDDNQPPFIFVSLVQPKTSIYRPLTELIYSENPSGYYEVKDSLHPPRYFMSAFNRKYKTVTMAFCEALTARL